MAEKKIEFTISAVDHATAVMNQVNANIAKMTAPYVKLARSAKAFSDNSGLTKVANNLGKVASEAGKAAASITKMAAPLLAIVGGGTLAGLSSMVTHWERIGMETERTSRLLGITASELTSMRGAAGLMGVSADAMTSGFQSLQDTLQDARWGRNQAAFATLQALGIQLHTTKAGAVDTQRAMYDLADRMQAIQKRDPAAARNLARSLGVEQLLPVLIQGSKAMQAYEDRARHLRGDFTPDMAQRATQFTQSVSSLGLAVEGIKVSISDKLAPVLGPMIDRFSEWIAKNRELISSRIAAMIERIANALIKMVEGTDWDTFLDKIDKTVESITDLVTWILKAVDAIGGFKTVAAGLAIYMTGSFVASMVTAVASIGGLVIRVGGLLASMAGAGTAASTAIAGAEVAAGGATAAGGAVAAGGEIAAGTAAAAGGGGLLAGIGSGIGALINPITAGIGAMIYSPGLNKGEDAQLARIRGAEQQTGGKFPGAQPVGKWAEQLNFAGLEKQNGLPPGLLAAIAQVESHGNAGAVNKASGAAGLFQFMPATAKEYGINPFDSQAEAGAAATKLGKLIQRYHGDVSKAIAAYNWGEGNLDRKGMANAPAETRQYVPKVLAEMGTHFPVAPAAAPAVATPAPVASLAGGTAPPIAPLNAAPAPMSQAAAPVVNVNTQVHVERDGKTSVRTETPNGLHVSYPMADAA